MTSSNPWMQFPHQHQHQHHQHPVPQGHDHGTTNAPMQSVHGPVSQHHHQDHRQQQQSHPHSASLGGAPHMNSGSHYHNHNHVHNHGSQLSCGPGLNSDMSMRRASPMMDQAMSHPGSNMSFHHGMAHGNSGGAGHNMSHHNGGGNGNDNSSGGGAFPHHHGHHLHHHHRQHETQPSQQPSHVMGHTHHQGHLSHQGHHHRVPSGHDHDQQQHQHHYQQQQPPIPMHGNHPSSSHSPSGMMRPIPMQPRYNPSVHGESRAHNYHHFNPHNHHAPHPQQQQPHYHQRYHVQGQGNSGSHGHSHSHSPPPNDAMRRISISNIPASQRGSNQYPPSHPQPEHHLQHKNQQWNPRNGHEQPRSPSPTEIPAPPAHHVPSSAPAKLRSQAVKMPASSQNEDPMGPLRESRRQNFSAVDEERDDNSSSAGVPNEPKVPPTSSSSSSPSSSASAAATVASASIPGQVSTHSRSPSKPARKPSMDDASLLLRLRTNASPNTEDGDAERKEDNKRDEPPVSMTSFSVSSSTSSTPVTVPDIPPIPKNYPTRLSLPSDRAKLNSLHCFIRSELLEIFVVEHSKLKGPSSSLGRVGLRCVHCAVARKTRGSAADESIAPMAVIYPKSISDIYRLVTSWQRCHLRKCLHLPPAVRHQWEALRKSDKSRGKTVYWIDSAKSIGLVDCQLKSGGIRFSTEQLSTIDENKDNKDTKKKTGTDDSVDMESGEDVTSESAGVMEDAKQNGVDSENNNDNGKKETIRKEEDSELETDETHQGENMTIGSTASERETPSLLGDPPNEHNAAGMNSSKEDIQEEKRDYDEMNTTN